MSYSFTTTSSFTITNARYVASKIAADLRLCHNYYGYPGADIIPSYAEEFAQLLNKGYVYQYEFGFKQDGQRVLCWRYTVDEYGNVTDNPPGSLTSSVDVSAARYYNYLWHSSKWNALPQSEREAFERLLPIQRTGCEAPSDGLGYWTSDKTYASGGRGVTRQTFRPIV